MTTHLTNYFSFLASKVDGRCENLTIVVDNAHIPAHHEEQKQQKVERKFEAPGRSRSDFFNASLPPRYPMHTSRWESSEGCNKKSDVCLCVPSRSRDVLVNKTSSYDNKISNKNDNKIHSRRSSLNRPTPSLDTVEKQLKILTPRRTVKGKSAKRSTLRSPPASPVKTRHQTDLPNLSPQEDDGKKVSERYSFLSIRILSDEPDTSVTCIRGEKGDRFHSSKRNQHQYKSIRNRTSIVSNKLDRNSNVAMARTR